MKNVVISDLYPCFCKELSKCGYNIIPSKKIEAFPEPEQKHADMQVLKVKDKIFTLETCAKTAGETYPQNILLNCLYMNNTLFGRLDAVDDSVLEYCKNNNIRLVNVNQGYTGCSTLVINNNAAVTADKSIEKALTNNGAEVLLIKPGYINLKGFDYGFIGGASFSVNGKVFFFGNIKNHPDYNNISEFCQKYNSKIEILCKDMPLTDIGGGVLL